MVGQDSPAQTDWLPAGWTVEVRVRKNGKKDKYYFDPSNGHRFDSKPEVLRYLKSIEIDNSTPKRKRRHVSKQSAIISPAVAEQQTLGESGKNGQICNNQSSKLSGVEKDEQNFRSACTGNCTPLSEHTSEQCMEEARMSNAKTLEDKDSDPLSVCSSAHSVEDFPENLPSENGVRKSEEDRKTQLGLSKLRQKKELGLPRRASKRLAGVQADPEELKYNSPACRVAARKSNEAKASTGERDGNLNTIEEHIGKSEREIENDEKPSNTLVLSPNNPSTPEEHSRKIETECKADEKPFDHLIMPPNNPKNTHVLSPNNPSTPEEHSRKIETECKADEKSFNHLIMPPKNPKDSLVLSPNNPSIPEEHSRMIETECKADEKPRNTLVLPPNNPSTPEEHDVKADENTRSSGDLWTDPCIEFAIKTLTGSIPMGDDIKVDENPISFQGSTFGDSWTDPCIEFAVKTLTGEIPVGDDLGIEDYFHRQLSSSENGGTKGLTLPNDALNHFCQTNLVCQHFDAMEKPTSPPNGSFSLEISGDAQRDKCYRERVL